METEVATTSYLEDVEQRLCAALAAGGPGDGSGAPVLLEAARRLVLAPNAKRIRPLLVAQFGHAVSAPREGLVDVGAAGELIHGGSLLHDDVVDVGSTRRGLPTANAVWGNAAAVLAGDLCLTLAFVQIRRHPVRLTEEAVDAIATMSRAAMLEVETRRRLDVAPAVRREIAEGKTGALFAWCGRSAAALVGDEEAALRFGRAGLRLGVAFQLADDLLDLFGGAHKDRFSDIRNGEPTFPVLTAAVAEPEIRERLARAWAHDEISAADARAVGEMVLETSAVAETAIVVASEVDSAVRELGAWAKTPGCAEVVGWARLLVETVPGGGAR